MRVNNFQLSLFSVLAKGVARFQQLETAHS